ncbi:MAG: RNA polymerase sigma-70 factor [Balneolales bacterium]
MDRSTEIFEQHRSGLFRLAYGMLERVALAEDAVQEAYLRWKQIDDKQILKKKSYLYTIVSNLCLDELKSARNRKERYVGPDLPEPLLISDSNTPEQSTIIADSLSMALMVTLKQLTPVQRAVFLLREVFDYEYSSIANILGKSESYCRKIGQRARQQIKDNRPSYEPVVQEKHRIVESFMNAVRNGNMKDLEFMLADDAILYSDGGGKVGTARKPIQGGTNVAKFLNGIRKKTTDDPYVEFEVINGEPGIIAYLKDQLHSVWSFSIYEGVIHNIYVVLNPDKLEHLKSALLRG